MVNFRYTKVVKTPLDTLSFEKQKFTTVYYHKIIIMPTGIPVKTRVCTQSMCNIYYNFEVVVH